jgi:hypothetical protein
VEVTSGDVVVHVPAGAYRVDAGTRAGDVTLDGVRHDDDARGTIVMTRPRATSPCGAGRAERQPSSSRRSRYSSPLISPRA